MSVWFERGKLAAVKAAKVTTAASSSSSSSSSRKSLCSAISMSLFFTKQMCTVYSMVCSVDIKGCAE